MMRMKRRLLLKITFAASLAAAVLCGGGLPARAGLMLMPTDIIFKDRQRTANLTLINTGQDEATYKIGFRYQRQNESGSYDLMKEPMDPKYDLAKMVVFSPRQVTLLPGGKQGIRLSLRRPANLPDGEYRAHLLLMRQSPETSALKSAESKAEKGGVKVALGANIGFSLPVIVRQGAYDATASVSDPRFSTVTAQGRTGPQLEIILTHSGKFSTLGHVAVFWTPPGGAERRIGTLNNVNVHTETARRKVSIPLKESQVSGGTIRILYEGDGPDKGITFDEKTFPVGG